MLLNLLTNASVEFSFTNPTMTQVRDMGFTGQSPFVAIALTGLLLLQLHGRHRPFTWPLVGVSLAVPLLLALFLIH